MKNVLNILIPIIVVILIYFTSTIIRTNYDIRYLSTENTKVTVAAKEIKPAGTTSRMMRVGNSFLQIPVTHVEEPTLHFVFEGDNEVIVDKSQYHKINIGQVITVSYYKPKYYGEPFTFSLIE